MTNTTTTTATANQLHAWAREAGWKPAQIRETAALYPQLPADTLAAMTAEADRIEALGRDAAAELERRRNLPSGFTGYVS